MYCPRNFRLFVIVVLLCVAAEAPSAAAQSGPGGDVDLQAFRPALDSRGFITVNGAQVLGHGELSFGLVTNWGSNLLAFDSETASYRVQHLITSALVGAVGLGLGPIDMQLGLSVPVAVMAGDRDPDTVDSTGDPNNRRDHEFVGQGLGDMTIHGKLRLLRRDRGAGIGLAVVGALQMPTASTERWLGAGTLRPYAAAVIDGEIGRFMVAANGGLRLHGGGSSVYRDDVMTTSDGSSQPTTGEVIEVGATVPLGLGVAYALVPQRIELIGEIFGEIPLAAQNYQPVELLTGLRVYMAANSFLSIG
ncbi:MAG: hypothetical protein AAGC55_28455, partial [Myxococcota bacterium]